MKAILYEYKGRTMKFAELMKFSKVKRYCLKSRLRYGWGVEEALMEKVNEKTLNHARTKATVDAELNKSNKERKNKIHDIGQIPWLVGEQRLSVIPETKKTPQRNIKIKRAKNIEKKCESCGATVWKSHADLRDYKDSSIRCYSCLQKGKEELNKAMINLAKRKGLIK